MSDDKPATPVVEETLEEMFSRVLQEHDYQITGISLTMMELLGRVAQLEAERGE